MFSKKGFYQIISAVLVVVGTLTGCHLKVGEEPPPQVTQTFNGTQCLSEVLPYFTLFWEGTATDQQVSDTWTCMGFAVEKFKKYVRGKASDRYTSQELATFLQDNFMQGSEKQKTIGSALQLEAMKLKRIFVGGSVDYLTMQELETFISLFSSLKSMSLKINPYMKVFALNWQPSNHRFVDDLQYFEEANEAVQEFAKDLAALVQKNNLTYRLQDFVVFFRELNKLYDKPWSIVADIEKFMPVVEKIKKAIAGGEEGQIGAQEWRRFLLLGTRGYVQYLRYRYFISADEEGTSSRVGYAARALEDSLSLMQDMVSEKETGVVSRHEIMEMLTALSTAWPDFKISEKLVLEVMRLKQLLIGGSLDELASSDFANARLKVERFKVLVDKSIPYFDLYGGTWKTSGMAEGQAHEFFKAARENLIMSSQEIGSLLEGDYDLENIESIVNELVTLYPEVNNGRDVDWDDAIESYLPVAIETKNMLFGEKGSVITQARWSSLLQVASKVYFEGLFVHYFMPSLDLKSIHGVGLASQFIDQIHSLLQDLIQLTPAKRFAQSDLEKIGRHLVQADLLPKKIDREVVRLGLNVLLNRFLVTPENRIAKKHPQALTLQSVDILRYEAHTWLQMELFIHQVFAQNQSSLSSGQVQRIFSDKYKVKGLPAELNTSLYEMILMLKSSVPLVINSQDYQIISARTAPRYDRRSLVQLNMNRILTRLLMRAYAKDGSRLRHYQGITLPEAQQAFKELRTLALKLDLTDSLKDNFASSRFLEANIFVSRADGNQLLSFVEGTDLVGMIWSGLSINSDLSRDLARTCLGRSSYNSNSRVSLECLSRVYRKQMPQRLRSLPEFLTYLQNVPEADWNIYLYNVLKAAGYVPTSDQVIPFGDAALAPHVIQYIEMVYAKYDKNEDSLIDTPEALTAFPVFKDLIRQYAGGAVEEKDLDSVFTYILRYGKPPETLMEKAKFLLSWKGKPHKWDVRADRTQLSKILGYIADQSAKSANLKLDLRQAKAAGY